MWMWNFLLLTDVKDSLGNVAWILKNWTLENVLIVNRASKQNIWNGDRIEHSGCTAVSVLQLLAWATYSALLNAFQFSSVQFSRSVVSDSLQPHELQHDSPPCPSQTPGIYPNSCPLSRWCHPAISSSVVPFPSCPQSLPASESFPVSQLFTWGGQSTGVSASASVLLMNTQDWSSLGWTGWISLQSKGLSRVFSNTTIQKHQFFSTQLPL